MTKPSYMELYAAQEARCFYCGKLMGPSRSDTPHRMGWTVDHFVPKTRGGRSLNKNMVLCHSVCNGAKSNRWPTGAEMKRFNALYKKIKSTRERVRVMESGMLSIWTQAI